MKPLKLQQPDTPNSNKTKNETTKIRTIRCNKQNKTTKPRTIRYNEQKQN